MARVTVEDCVEKVPNRFDLVMLAAQRSRDIATGSQLTVERDNDKNPVVALREIADETIDIDTVKDSLIRGLQKYVDNDEPEVEDEMEKVVSSLTESGIDLDDFSSVDTGGDSAQRFEDVDTDDLED